MSGKEAAKEFEGQVLIPVILKHEIDGQTMNYALLDQGHSSMVVFLHGAPGSWSAFVDYLKNDELASKANLLSIDRPGYGYSNFGDAVVSLEEQAYFIKQVINNHPSEHIILVGHSLGGPVAARLAMDYPDLVDGMVLVAPSIDPAQEKGEWYRPLGHTWLGKLMLPKSLWVTNEEIYFLKEELELMEPEWSNITVRTILIHGEDDDLVPVENAQFARSKMNPDILTVQIFPEVNHFIPWNQPQLIYQAIDELLDQ
ncbi:MAG: alpha/beta hydrolase [Cyclobacteriaceae bacterium]